jgi:hypothetical protein
MNVDPNCPLCPDNGKVNILASTQDAYIVQAVRDGEPLDGAYLLVPNKHTPVMPMWLIGQLYQLADRLDLEFDNISINLSKNGGKTLEHFHAWLLIRDDDTRLGMHGLIERNEELSRANASLRAERQDLATVGWPA